MRYLFTILLVYGLVGCGGESSSLAIPGADGGAASGDPCAANDCGGYGRCVRLANNNTRCQCEPGYEQPDDEVTCVSLCAAVDCSGNGTCTINDENEPTCNCAPGFLVDPNDETQCLSPCEGVECSGHGTCMLDPSNAAQCECEQGYRHADDDPTQCVSICDGVDCSGHGDCVVSPENTATCECRPGYALSPTDPTACVSVCEGIECSGHGTCAANSENEPVCTCEPGFVTDVDDPRTCVSVCAGVDCSGHGTCSADVENTPICACEPGFALGIDDPTQCISVCADIDCSGHGECGANANNEAVCTCEAGYISPPDTPTVCVSVCADIDCSGHGQCQASDDNSPVCQCEPGFVSPDGEPTSCRSVCADVDCSGHGRCEAAQDNSPVCLCDPGFISPEGVATECRSVCADVDCSGHGQCAASDANTPECSCEFGFVNAPGNLVECVSVCAAVDCSGHGECVIDAGGDAACTCERGYVQDDADPTACRSVCADVDCGGHGECATTDAGDPTCQCDEGYLADGLVCVLNPPTLSVRIIDVETQEEVSPDQLQLDQTIDIEVRSDDPARRGEFIFDDDAFVIRSTLGVLQPGERLEDQSRNNGVVRYRPTQPGQLSFTASVEWRVTGEVIPLEVSALVGLLSLPPAARPQVSPTYRLNALDAVRRDASIELNEMNIEYVPVQFAEDGYISAIMVANADDIIANFGGAEDFARRIWRTARLSFHDANMQELTASYTGTAGGEVVAQVRANELYFIGVSYYALCLDGSTNLDRHFGLDVPNCASGIEEYIERDALDYRYQLAITPPGRVAQLNINELTLGSLDATDTPVPYFDNNFMDTYLVALEPDILYNFSITPTRAADDVLPIVSVFRPDPGNQRFDWSHYDFDRDAEPNFPFMTGSIRTSERAEYAIMITNNNAIQDPGLGLGYTVEVREADPILVPGEPENILLDGARSLRSAWDQPRDRRPVIVLGLPEGLSGRYQLSLQPTGFPVVVAKLGRSASVDFPNSPHMSASEVTETNPDVEISRVTFEFIEGIQYSIGMTVPQDAVGGPVLIRLDACDDLPGGCNPCAEVDCDGHGVCAVNDDGLAECTCDDGYVNGEEALDSCVDPCERSACGPFGQCQVVAEAAQCFCGPGFRRPIEDAGACTWADDLNTAPGGDADDQAAFECTSLVQCLNDCPNAVCSQACLDEATPNSLERLTGLLECAEIMGCADPVSGRLDEACLERGCADQRVACFGAEPAPPAQACQNNFTFEGDDDLANFAAEGDTAWSSTALAAHAGMRSVQSGDITHDETSSMTITVTAAQDGGSVSFWHRVSSEATYDYLNFYINAELINRWSGDTDWALAQFVLEAGQNTLTWEYVKDGSVDNGQDTAWVDDIDLEGCLPGQEPGGDGGDPPDGDAVAQCTALVRCLNTCNQGDAACQQQCFAEAPDEAEDRFQAVISCAQINQCVDQVSGMIDQGCLNVSCAAELAGCFGEQ